MEQINTTHRNREPLLVSVIVPAYRCADTIERAIDSVLIQQVPLELLVLNDQSPDHLDEVMQKYEADPRVRYMKNETNIGAAATRNRGVSLATGIYIAFLDSDDWWTEGKLAVQIERLEASGAVLCATARELVTPQGELTGRVIPVREKITYQALLTHNCINCSSVVMKAEVAKAYPMEHEDSHEDYILWLRILRKYRWAIAVNEPMLKYRLSASGKSGNKLKSAGMTYLAYRYAGFGRIASAGLFCAYALNGVLKYAKAYMKQ